MLDNILEEIMEKYPKEKTKPFAGNSFAETIRNTVPQLFKSYFLDRIDFIWQASPGKGNWAGAPWIAILNPLITQSPQEGYYPVYLFNDSFTMVYLSLNQGVTKIREEFNNSNDAKNILKHRAEIIRHRITPEYQKSFDVEPIKLGGPGTLLSWYEMGHVIGKKYLLNEIPPTDQIIFDLNEILRLYDLSLVRGGWEEFEGIEQLENQSNEYLTLEEKRKIRYHKVIERNSKLAKEAKMIHGYKCMACGFNFESSYGEIGKDFIEAHHKTPISQLPLDRTVRLSPKDDFIVLCSNCHSMLHRKGAPESLDEFRILIAKHK